MFKSEILNNDNMLEVEFDAVFPTFGGNKDYEKLENKPSINGVELNGNKTNLDLKIDQEFVKDNDYVHTDNNYTDEEKVKLKSLENYNDSEVKKSINNLETNKADKNEIPDVSSFITKSVNDLANYYLKSETYSQAEVNQLIGNISTINMKAVDELPDMNIKANVIYLVPTFDSEEQNIYDEYVHINEKWELIGTTKVDLTDYVKKNEIPTKTSQLTNDSDYVNSTFVNNAISNAIGTALERSY